MSISIDDRQLVESYQAGDTDAFAELVRAHGSSLMGHALRKLSDRAAAEDAVQETFVRAFRALPRFNGDYRVGPWLHRILANVCIDEGNRRRREAEKFDRFAADPFAVDLAPGVEDELGLDLDDAALADALASLPPTYREALNLRFVQELPYDEVARIAGVTEQNARARVSRARSAARSALRGVAAIPALLIPALRRSESVAAAATGGGDGVRMAAEAAVASAPAATPVITKAVVGLGLVAAMAAPSSAPQPDHPRAVVAAEAAEAPAVVDDGAPADAAAAAAGASAGQSVAPTSGQGTDVATPAQNVAEPTPASEPTATPATDDGEAAVVDPAPLPAPGRGRAPVTDPEADEPAEPVVPAPVVRTGGTLTISDLVATAAGPRLDVTGAATLVVGDRTLSGTVSGRMTATDQVDLRRYSATLVLTLDDGTVVDLRLQLQGRPVGDQVEVPLAEVTAFDLAGPFRSVNDESVALLEAGSATGRLDTAAQVLELRLG